MSVLISEIIIPMNKKLPKCLAFIEVREIAIKKKINTIKQKYISGFLYFDLENKSKILIKKSGVQKYMNKACNEINN